MVSSVVCDLSMSRTGRQFSCIVRLLYQTMSNIDKLSRSRNAMNNWSKHARFHLVDGISSRSMLSRLSKRDLSRKSRSHLSSKFRSFECKQTHPWSTFRVELFGLEMIIVRIVPVRMDRRSVSMRSVQFYSVNRWVFSCGISSLSNICSDWRMKNLFVCQIHAVQSVRIDICVDFMVIKVIKSITNMIFGIHLHVNIVHVDDIIALYAKVFNVNINSVWTMRFKKHDRIVVVFHVDKANNVITTVISSK